MPTSRGPQVLQAPSALLLWIAPSLFLAYTDWLPPTWGRLALLWALFLLVWRLSAHIPSPFAVTMHHNPRAILRINNPHPKWTSVCRSCPRPRQAKALRGTPRRLSHF